MKRHLCLSVGIALALFGVHGVWAAIPDGTGYMQIYQFDADLITPGVQAPPTSGTGTWDLTTANWTLDGGTTYTPWPGTGQPKLTPATPPPPTASIAQFGAGTYNINVSGSVKGGHNGLLGFSTNYSMINIDADANITFNPAPGGGTINMSDTQKDIRFGGSTSGGEQIVTFNVPFTKDTLVSPGIRIQGGSGPYRSNSTNTPTDTDIAGSIPGRVTAIINADNSATMASGTNWQVQSTPLVRVLFSSSNAVGAQPSSPSDTGGTLMRFGGIGSWGVTAGDITIANGFVPRTPNEWSFASKGNMTLSHNWAFGTSQVIYNCSDLFGDSGEVIFSGILTSGGASQTLTIGRTAAVADRVIAFTNPANSFVYETVNIIGHIFRVGPNLGGISTAAKLQLDSNATLEAQGTLNKPLGTAAGQVGWSAVGTNRFAGKAAKLTVDLNTLATADNLTWGSTGFGTLGFGSPTSDAEVEFVDNVDLGGVTRSISVLKNPVGVADFATMSGVISNGGLDKTDAGKLVLTTANTYGGGTNVVGGILLANNTTGSGTGSGSVTVQSGATLGGTGTIAGAVTINAGGFLKPGASIGTLTVNNNVTLASNSTLTIELGAASAADLINLTGSFMIDDTASTGTTLNLVNVGGAWGGGDYQIITAGTFTQQFHATKVVGLDSGYYLDYSTANQLWLRVLAAALLGDLNGDNVVNNQDIAPFVLALTDLPTWQSTYPTLNILQVGDINGDNVFNNQDIAPFVTLLTGSGTSHSAGEVNAIPEPASLGLLAIGGLLVSLRRRRA